MSAQHFDEYEVWGNEQVLTLEKYLIYLSFITTQFLSFFHWRVFDLFLLLRGSENDLLLQLRMSHSKKLTHALQNGKTIC